jgi:hypothetical protein
VISSSLLIRDTLRTSSAALKTTNSATTSSQSVKRLWIYETNPASSIRYVATISDGKRPGEIRDPSGLRNDEFDRGDLEGRVKYAYEIQKLEELPEPHPLEDLNGTDG